MPDPNDPSTDVDAIMAELLSGVDNGAAETREEVEPAAGPRLSRFEGITWPAGCLFPHSRWGASSADLARWAGWTTYLKQVYDALMRTLFRRSRSTLSSWNLGLMLGDDWTYHVRRGFVGLADFNRKAILVRPWLVRTKRVRVTLEAVLAHEIVHVLAGERQNHGRPFLRRLFRVHQDARNSDRFDLASELWTDLRLHAQRERVPLADITVVARANGRAASTPRE